MRFPLCKPFINDDITSKVLSVLKGGILTEGRVTREFEEACREYLECAHCIAVSSCTVGLETALRCLEIGPGDEVIVPDYTYPATASVVEIVGAKIILVDVDPESMLIDYDAIEGAITQRTKAVIPVSLFGNPLNYERLSEIKEKYNIYIVEDAACSMGAEFKDIKVGNFADISVFSFHPRKFITTGEGGLITTNNKEWSGWMSSFKHFGMEMNSSRLTTSFDRIGTNYKLSNILAAVGLGQMTHIEALLSKRRVLAQNYLRLLNDHPEVRIPEVTRGGFHSYQSFCVHIENRNEVMSAMRDMGIEVQIGTYSLHMHRAFKENSNCRIIGDMSGSRYAFEHGLSFPLYHELRIEDQQYIIQKLLQTMS